MRAILAIPILLTLCVFGIADFSWADDSVQGNVSHVNHSFEQAAQSKLQTRIDQPSRFNQQSVQPQSMPLQQNADQLQSNKQVVINKQTSSLNRTADEQAANKRAVIDRQAASLHNPPNQQQLPVQNSQNDNHGSYSNYHNDNDKHDDKRWNKGQHWDRHAVSRREFHYRPHYDTHKTIIYYEVIPSYYGETYYSESTSNYYSGDGYVPSYTIGGYLPNNVYWQVLKNYAWYGLPAPNVGQKWMRYGHDAVLIDANFKILQGIYLTS